MVCFDECDLGRVGSKNEEREKLPERCSDGRVTYGITTTLTMTDPGGNTPRSPEGTTPPPAGSGTTPPAPPGEISILITFKEDGNCRIKMLPDFDLLSFLALVELSKNLAFGMSRQGKAPSAIEKPPAGMDPNKLRIHGG